MSVTPPRDYTRDHCRECADSGRNGTCARLRCYCGHATCWAFDSYVPLKDIPIPALPTAADTRQAASWANREEPTWLDR